MDFEYIFRVGKWYYAGSRNGVQWSTDINEADIFNDKQDLLNELNSEVYEWISVEVKEKMEQVGEPIIIENIIKSY